MYVDSGTNVIWGHGSIQSSEEKEKGLYSHRESDGDQQP
jgi:hypothetical protein